MIALPHRAQHWLNPQADRASWGPGPWDKEPDKVQWSNRHGQPCLAVRHPTNGHWCGYVGMNPGHPWHGAGDEIPVRVHGGITFASPCHEEGPIEGRICHVPMRGQPADVWWLGFDCAHGGDLSPMITKLREGHGFSETARRILREVYRDFYYVRGQCAKLARQAREVAP